MIKGNIRDLPRLRLTESEFRALLDYSGSLPTGTTIGKRWKRLDGVYDREWVRRGGKPAWMVGEYYDIGSETQIGIRWYRPVIMLTNKISKAA